MRILVTGGAGFLGSEVVPALAKVRGYEIQVMDSFSRGFPKKPPKRKNWLPPISGNVCNYYDILRTTERFRPQIVVHLAAFNSRPESFGDFRTCAQTNYLGTANVLQACLNVRNRPQKLVFASTLAAADPAMHYGVSKRAAEDLLLSILPRFQEFDMGLSILRFAEIYGNAEPYSSTCLVNFLVDHMLAGNDVALYGVTHQKDFIHLSDATRAVELAVKSEIKYPPVLDIGTGQGQIIRDVVHKIKEVTDYKGRLRFIESEKVPVRDEVANPVPASEILGFTAIADFDKELAALVSKRRKAIR